MPKTKTHPPVRCLWEPSSFSKQEEVDYETIYQRYAIRPKGRSFGRICSSAVVVVQEVALTLFLFLRHRVTLMGVQSNRQVQYTEVSTIAMLVALIIAVASSSSRRHNRMVKAATRTMDAALLAVILRFISTLLQSLTASYSSDTVTQLAVSLLTVHVMLCDYSYANGRSVGETTSVTADVAAAASHITPTPSKQRPPFLGGTLALNAAISATTLLTSRTADSSVSYAFVGLAVLLFGLYPQTRNAVASCYPAHRSGVLWWITAVLCVADILLLLALEEHYAIQTWHPYCMTFGAVIVLLLFVIPAYKCFWMQRCKVVLRGPWDIPQRSTMQLDYYEKRTNERVHPMT